MWCTSSDKLERGYDRAIYVLGADHHATAKWYAAIARMLGYDEARVEVLMYQFVHLTKGGEASKASKRAGNVVFLDDVMDEIGVDAARWYLVNRGPDQTIEIDLDPPRSLRRPGLLQYACRIAGDHAGQGMRSAARRRGPEARRADQTPTDSPTVREALPAGPSLAVPCDPAADATIATTSAACRRPAQAFRLISPRDAAVIARSLDLVGVAAPDSIDCCLQLPRVDPPDDFPGCRARRSLQVDGCVSAPCDTRGRWRRKAAEGPCRAVDALDASAVDLERRRRLLQVDDQRALGAVALLEVGDLSVPDQAAVVDHE
jgi:arginyl-tRNA synthetase